MTGPVTPSDRQGAGSPDPDLLAAVETSVWDYGFSLAAAEARVRGRLNEGIATVALAAAGRVLARTLDAEAADYDRVAGQAAFPERGLEIGRQADRTRDCAALVRRLCGVPEGGS